MVDIVVGETLIIKYESKKVDERLVLRNYEFSVDDSLFVIYLFICQSVYLFICLFYMPIYDSIKLFIRYRMFRKNCVFSQFTATPPSPTSL